MHFGFLPILFRQQKERRHEVKMRRKLELKEITENATVLKDMLDQIEEQETNGSTEEISEDAIDTLKCLYVSCHKLQPTILILIGDTEDNDCLGKSHLSNFCNFFFETTRILIKIMCHFRFCTDDALEANDLVTAVFRKYHQLIIKTNSKIANNCLISTPSSSNIAAQNGTNKNTMDELHEIFASNSNVSHSNSKPAMTLAPLEPTLVDAKVKTNGNFGQFFLVKYFFI